MATTFPLSTYPLSDKTRMSDDHTVARDLLDDGTMRVRVLGGSTYRLIRCVFENLTESQASTLEDYLITNRVTEFDMVLDSESPITTYQGYLWGDPQITVAHGVLHSVRVDFRGEVV